MILSRKKGKSLACLMAMAVLAGGCGNAGESSGGTAAEGRTVSLTGEDRSGQGAQGASEGLSAGGASYEQPEMKGEITVSVMFEQEFLTTAAEEFMKKYPDVKVTLNTGIENFGSTGGENDIANYRTALNTRIMSGKAEDIIFTSLIPVQKYMDMGVFEDLGGYVAGTPEMTDENYFMNVLTSAKDSQGRLYILPYQCSFWTLGFGGDLGGNGNSGSTVRFSEAAARAKQMVDGSTLPNTFLTLMGPDGYMNYLIREYRETLIDMEGKSADVNTDQYIGWLKEAKELLDQGYFLTDSSFDFYNMEYHIAMQEDLDAQAAFYDLLPDSDVCGTAPIADAGGNVYTNYSDCIGINSASANKALAWEFVKYVLSPEVQCLPSMYGTPVNREGFAAYVKRQMTLYADAGSVSEADYGALLEKWISQINKCDTMDPAVIGFFGEENQKFFDGKQSAEQTAQEIQNRVMQYLTQ